MPQLWLFVLVGLEEDSIHFITVLDVLFNFQSALCAQAQARLTEAAADAEKQLLPTYANNDLSSVCTWADRVKFALRWTSALHFADTPPKLCNFQYASMSLFHSYSIDSLFTISCHNLTSQPAGFDRSMDLNSMTLEVYDMMHLPIYLNIHSYRGLPRL
ncbi:endonuclease 4-like [Lathyrus oleraceus]|uniref:endonuclease 4-like n=1 Tax=Pisum sativum TaxID=3888 RepID=UPI0021D360E1|nr:endonuclease 4-like [Pisum sativum]